MKSESAFEALQTAKAFVLSRIPEASRPAVGVVLGSGLGGWADSLEEKQVVPYSEVPGMPRPKVVGHAGNLVFGTVGETRVACLQGRVHAYEGHPMDDVVFGSRLLAQLGCEAVLLTNAAGGIRAGFAPADLMLIQDHLNLFGKNPLMGENDSRFGTRFPDMTEAYAIPLRRLARVAAANAKVTLHEGVYAGLLGPTYETPAEIRMLRTLGADAVGMSTVPEILALRHMGVAAGAISCITNLAAGISPTKLDHAEVEETARAARDSFVTLLSGWVQETGTWLKNGKTA